MRIYVPKRMSTEIEVNDFTFKNEIFATFTFVVKDKKSKDFLTSFSNFY